MIFLGYYMTDEIRTKCNKRCAVFPFTKRQGALTNLATKLPGNELNGLTSRQITQQIYSHACFAVHVAWAVSPVCYLPL
jgi:hypothetical protein